MARAAAHRHRRVDGVMYTCHLKHTKKRAGRARTRVASSTVSKLRLAAAHRPRDRFGRFK